MSLVITAENNKIYNLYLHDRSRVGTPETSGYIFTR